MTSYSRKDFIRLFTKGVGCFAVAATLPYTPGVSKVLATVNARQVHFPQGLASGDPTDSTVVLWTRAVRTNGSTDAVPVKLLVSEDENFSRIVAEKGAVAEADADFTVRIIVYDLKPDTRYFYKFESLGAETDITGRTRTAPRSADRKKVKIAFASCQSFEGGYYSAYRRLIDEDKKLPDEEQIDFVLHLGDYIYETLGYGTARKLPDFPSGGGQLGEGVEWAHTFAQTLEDYRHLYNHYHMDPDLKEARARWPFIVTWDDHEFTDDSWQGVATYTTPNEPNQSRKFASNRAWFEHIPAFLTGLGDATGVEQPAHDLVMKEVVDAPLELFDDHGFNMESNNVKAVDSLRIYRKLNWGKNVDLIVSDTRSYRSKHPVPGQIALEISGNARYIAPVELVKISDAGREWNNGNPPEFIQLGENRIPNLRKDSPRGTMLGPDQKNWVKQMLKESDAVWKVFASSVPMMPMRLDLNQVNPEAANAIFTTDTWEGYLSEREELLKFLKDEGIDNFISLAGDNHNSFAGVLKDDFESPNAVNVGAEFTVCGISSTSVFHALTAIIGEDDPMRPVVTFDSRPHGGTNPSVENLNTSFMWGTQAAIGAARTGSGDKVNEMRNPTQNPHLRYVDSAAYGIAVVEFDEKHAKCDFIVIAMPGAKEPADGVFRRRATLEIPVRNGSEDDNYDLKITSIEGTPPFPL